MSTRSKVDYLSIGGNRQTAASAWSTRSKLLVFGADSNIAIWSPTGDGKKGIQHLLSGHNDKVTAITLTPSVDDVEYILSGSSDGQLFAWRLGQSSIPSELIFNVTAHTGAVNSIAALDGTSFFVTGGANAQIKLWKLQHDCLNLIATLETKPRYIPLTLALAQFQNVDPQHGLLLIAGGTKTDIYVYGIHRANDVYSVSLQATLKGHEGWINSLALKKDHDTDLLLASASFDKYVRIWRFSTGQSQSLKPVRNGTTTPSAEMSLTAKVQTVSIEQSSYSITFEALLLGHDDWVYSAAWNLAPGSEQLMTASADGSLAIWEPDSTSGIWINASKLGEISGQKGATTATGSSGGFWAGLWSPDGLSVVALGRTGSWRLWQFDPDQEYWNQRAGISGHISSASGISWSDSGDYLLSTSLDQTTRLHAEWRSTNSRSWHEFSRPQIHGYDLNCIVSTGPHQFVSGADEKLLRVFNQPRDVAELLQRLCDIAKPTDQIMPDAAAIPVLGLSNKVIGDSEGGVTELGHAQEYIGPDSLDTSIAVITEPPTEDLLSRHTLWPEHEKLYGHGYEISTCAFVRGDDTKGILATACKASSADHAVVRLYDAETWHELKPSLTAHSLTITSMKWLFESINTGPASTPDPILLSVGRDRQWSLFRRSSTTAEQHSHNSSTMVLAQSNSKAHSRMVLDAATTVVNGTAIFGTASRDKSVKLWSDPAFTFGDVSHKLDFREVATIKRSSAATAIHFLPVSSTATASRLGSLAVLAVGEETGQISIHIYSIDKSGGSTGQSPITPLSPPIELSRHQCPAKSVTQLAWRPESHKYGEKDGVDHRLAVAAADGSVRILEVDLDGALNGLTS